jgi:hypothetical protein
MVHAGRHNFEGQNRARYDSIWVTTGRAKRLLVKGEKCNDWLDVRLVKFRIGLEKEKKDI